MSPAEIDTLLALLPPIPSEPLRARIRDLVGSNNGNKLVVLDDDPTGTQTVYDIPVLTQWDTATLAAELCTDLACFYILTNSRSLPPDGTIALHRELARNLNEAATLTGRSVTLISRSDSTLRGHFPLETDVLTAECGPFDATFILPYFEAGGRVTIDDVHYVVENGTYTPAADTPFAKDAVFGYQSSNLREWVSEKTNGRVPAAEVHSISLATLRGPVDSIVVAVLELPTGTYTIVNAQNRRDVEAFALATIEAERRDKRYIYRSAAGFVSARLGLEPRPLWLPPDNRETATAGGLVVVGSHVPKSSAQLAHLLANCDIESFELDVSVLLAEPRQELIGHCVSHVNQWLASGRNAVYPSRSVVTGESPYQTLAIGNAVSRALVETVQQLETVPRFLIAKGGITSSDVATDGLGVKRAMVLGQILPGVSAWEIGAETRFPGMPYVVFPGNVGSEDSLAAALHAFNPPVET